MNAFSQFINNLPARRADYFGAIPNMAARVCATAQYGQTLIEPTLKLAGVGTSEHSLPFTPTHCEPSLLEFNGILSRRGMQIMPAMSSNRFRIPVSFVYWHPVTRRAKSDWPFPRAVWDKAQVVGNLPGGHKVARLSRVESRSKTMRREALRDDKAIPEGPAISLKLLGSFSLKAWTVCTRPHVLRHMIIYRMPGTKARRSRPTSTQGLAYISRPT